MREPWLLWDAPCLAVASRQEMCLRHLPSPCSQTTDWLINPHHLSWPHQLSPRPLRALNWIGLELMVCRLRNGMCSSVVGTSFALAQA